jgi:hypothetical protein
LRSQEATEKISEGETDMRTVVQQLLPYHQCHFNYRHPNLIHGLSGSAMELDIYFPELELAFEYQGKQHYHAIHQGSVSEQQKRDHEKRAACQKHNVTLIQVPYWWDGERASLAGTIKQHCPDIALALHPSDARALNPIPSTQPRVLRASEKVVSDPTMYFVQACKLQDYKHPTN